MFINIALTSEESLVEQEVHIGSLHTQRSLVLCYEKAKRLLVIYINVMHINKHDVWRF